MRHLFLLLLAFSMGVEAQYVVPNENLITENIPQIPKGIEAEVKKYTEARSAGFVAFHPTKKEIIMSTRFGNIAQLHYLSMPMGARKQISFFDEPLSNAVFNPKNPDEIFFTKDDGGNEFRQIFQYDLKTLKHKLLTDGKRSQNGNITFKKDGSGYFFTSTMRNGKDRDIYYVDIKQLDKPQLMFEVEGGGWGISSVSHDGNHLVVSNYVSVNESFIYQFDVQLKKLTPLTLIEVKGVVNSGGTFNKNKDGFWYITDKDFNFARLAYKNIKNNEVSFLSNLNWDVEQFEVSPNFDYIIYTTNEAGLSKMYHYDLKSKKTTTLNFLNNGLIGGFEIHNDNQTIGFSYSDAQSSSDIYTYDLKTKQLTKWTESELGGIQPTDIALPKLIEWPSFDGLKISGFYYPASKKFTGKRPVIINIHGGPEGQSFPNFIGASNYFTNELGVAIIYSNVRGSTGYGKEFVKLDNGFLRENSVKDIGALLDWIKTQPDLDADRIMVMGGSYGGYMTLAVSFHYADKIRCAVDIVGISNFVTFLKNTESYRRDLRRVEYGDERDPKMYEFLEKISPLNNVDKMTKPMFIIQGTNDPRVPVTEATQMRDKLKAKGNIVWYLEAKDEGHGFRKKANSDFQRLAMIMFMKEYLLN